MKYPPRGSELVGPGEIQRPIFGIDIDGTLGLYHEHFWNFACAWTGRDLPSPNDFRGGSFAQHLGLAKTTYRKIKLAYRRGGAKRSMPVVDRAGSLTKSLRDRGAVVVLCTTRPYLSLEGVDEDTRHWARRSKVSFDFITWGENKYRDLARFGSRVVAVLDDEPVMLKQAREVGIYAVGIRRPYNEYVDTDEWASNLSSAAFILNRRLSEWEARQCN